MSDKSKRPRGRKPNVTVEAEIAKERRKNGTKEIRKKEKKGTRKKDETSGCHVH